MKKRLISTLMAVVLLLSLLAMNTAVAACAHNNITGVGDEGYYCTYAKITATTHDQTTYMHFRCLDCGYRYTMQWNTDTFPHQFNGNTCALCGYVSTSSLGKPTQKELQSAAQNLGDRAKGSTVVVIHGGNIRQQPATASTDLGNVHANERYEVLDVEYTFGHVWYQVETEDEIGWISANLVQVLPGTEVPGGVRPELVGRMVEITVQSGRMRCAPGTASEKVGKIYKGRTTPILDCGYDQSGKLWYKVSNGHVEGWISSGLADLK